MKKHKKLLKRIESAVGNGVKTSVIANRSGISYYRMLSITKPDSYKGQTTFTCDEIKIINEVLDHIKKAI